MSDPADPAVRLAMWLRGLQWNAEELAFEASVRRATPEKLVDFADKLVASAEAIYSQFSPERPIKTVPAHQRTHMATPEPPAGTEEADDNEPEPATPPIDIPVLLLNATFGNGWRPTLTIGTYQRPWADGQLESCDTLKITDANHAEANRSNEDYRTVWETSGTLTSVLAALATLPAPGTPGAPTTPLH